MTFETEEGTQRAINYNKLVEANSNLKDIELWLGRKLEFARASEPSDIIWENRDWTPWDRKKKSIIVWTIISLVLFGSFIIMFKFTNISSKMAQKYPIIECHKLAKLGNETPDE